MNIELEKELQNLGEGGEAFEVVRTVTFRPPGENGQVVLTVSKQVGREMYFASSNLWPKVPGQGPYRPGKDFGDTPDEALWNLVHSWSLNAARHDPNAIEWVP